MARSSAIAAALAGAALAACYAPQFEDGLPCSATLQCPSGQRCDESANPPVCHPIGADTVDARDVDVPATADTDDDTIDDAVDNCRTLANTDQRDHDGDQVGDVCDNCPGIANADQADTTEQPAPDGVGDACDPWPALRDRVEVFDGFYDPLAPTWQVSGNATVSGGYLVPDPGAPFASTGILHTSTFPLAARIALEVSAEIDAVDPSKQYPSVKVMLEQRTHPGGSSDDYECGLSENTMPTPHQRAVDLHAVVADSYMYLDGQNVPTDGVPLLVRVSYERVGPTVPVGRLRCHAATASTALDLGADDSRLGRGVPGFYAYRARARFDYAIIYTDQP